MSEIMELFGDPPQVRSSSVNIRKNKRSASAPAPAPGTATATATAGDDPVADTGESVPADDTQPPADPAGESEATDPIGQPEGKASTGEMPVTDSCDIRGDLDNAAPDEGKAIRAQPESSEGIPRAELGPPFMAEFGALSIASDNPWGSDVADDQAYHRIRITASTPGDLEPLLVVRADNGWKVVGDPSGLLALAHVHQQHPDLAALHVPVREVIGSAEAIIYFTALQAIGGRVFKNMRRARLSLRICESESLRGKIIAERLGLHGSGTTRDLKAARMEREHPALAAILAAPSDAPVSYYTDLREYADRQPSPDKAMAALIATATRLVKVKSCFSPSDAKIALGISKPSVRKDRVETRVDLVSAAYAQAAVLERLTSGSTRLTITFPKDTTAPEEHVARLERWLASFEVQSGAAS